MSMNPIVIVIAAILDVLVVVAAYLIGGKVQKDTAEKSATGARLRSVPFTPEKVLAALKKA